MFSVLLSSSIQHHHSQYTVHCMVYALFYLVPYLSRVLECCKSFLISSCSSCSGIFGGNLLGVKSTNSLAFYTWDSLELVRRILIVPHKVYWSDNGELIAICTDEAYFILRFDQSAVDTAFEHKEDIDPEDGIEQAFDVSLNWQVMSIVNFMIGFRHHLCRSGILVSSKNVVKVSDAPLVASSLFPDLRTFS